MNPSKLATLLSRVKDGDGAAFEELYRCYFHRVFAVALSILKNEEDGKDAAQTVMTKLLLLPMDAFPASGENTWLYVITKNEALGILRKKNRESSASPEFWADIPDPRSELDQLLDLEAYRKLVQPLDGISREIVTLKILGGFTHRELAESLHLPAGTVRWKYHAAVHSLRLLWGDLAAFFLFLALSLASVPSLLREPAAGAEGSAAPLAPASLEIFPFFCFALPALLFLILFLPLLRTVRKRRKSAVDAADKPIK